MSAGKTTRLGLPCGRRIIWRRDVSSPEKTAELAFDHFRRCRGCSAHWKEGEYRVQMGPASDPLAAHLGPMHADEMVDRMRFANALERIINADGSRVILKTSIPIPGSLGRLSLSGLQEFRGYLRDKVADKVIRRATKSQIERELAGEALASGPARGLFGSGLTDASGKAKMNQRTEEKGMKGKAKTKARVGRPSKCEGKFARFLDAHGYTAESFAEEARKRTGLNVKTNSVYKWRVSDSILKLVRPVIAKAFEAEGFPELG